MRTRKLSALAVALMLGLGAGAGAGLPGAAAAGDEASAATAASATAASAATTATTQASRAATAAKPKLRLAWRDDFTGRAGKAPNRRNWTYDTQGGGWGNEQLEYSTRRPENVSLDGSGHLAITARSDNVKGLTCWYGPCRYTSARITTLGKRTAGHGRVEARIKLPAGSGLWPAFWLMGADYPRVGHPASGEIDVMEYVGQEPWRVWSSVHGPGYVRAGLTAPFNLPAGSTYAGAFHTFALDWSPQELAFSVDGTVYHRVPRSAVGDHEWVFDKPFFIILNLAVGGSWGGEPGPQTRFPARMLVDYVAVYRPVSSGGR